jgi:hypothetical protein
VELFSFFPALAKMVAATSNARYIEAPESFVRPFLGVLRLFSKISFCESQEKNVCGTFFTCFTEKLLNEEVYDLRQFYDLVLPIYLDLVSSKR